ncbi:MAG: hypothetical protein JSU58_08820 [Dehalococcoidales bacterium]|nr:MAG: hypothetical protein JSU58_08820 [Dehalococcoidales bacterium]
MLKSWFKKLVAPAEDPRKTYAPAKELPQELLRKVIQARTNLEVAKNQLIAKINQTRQKREQLQSQESKDVFTFQLQEMVNQELKGLELEVAELEQEEKELFLVEQKLNTQVEAISARSEALEARHQATEARVQVRKELEGLNEELTQVGMVLEKVEQRSEDIQTRTSMLDHIVDLGVSGTSTGFQDPVVLQLANRYASSANLDQPDSLKEQLGQGFKILLELEYEFGQLQAALTRGKETDPSAIKYIPRLATETYREAINVLKDNLELLESLRSPGEEKLTAEIKELELEIQDLRKDGTDNALAKARRREERLSSNQQRLAIIQRQQLKVDELLHQSSRCVATLNQTRLELAGLKADSIGTDIEAVIEALQRTISQAKEVQDEMKKMSF